MKKLSRIAALLAAGALLFGAVGCSDSDDDGGDAGGGVEVTASVAPAIELEEGKSDTYVVTCKVTGDTFSADAKSLDKGDEIPAGYLELTANDSKVTISEVKVSEKFTDAEGKVSIKVTAAAGAKSGTITAKLLKGALTDTTGTVTATPISYTIRGDSGGLNGATPATVKYLQLTNSKNSSNVTPDWSATVSDTSVVTATDLVWTLVNGLTHKQWDIKVENNGVAEAMLEEQTDGTGTENGLASVSFDITAVKALKLKTISAITSSGKTPTGITCWIGGKAVAQGVQYSDAATKAFKLSDASLDDYEVAAGNTVTIKITSDKTATASEGAKIDFGQISLTVETAE